MGNQNSSSDIERRLPFARSTGALGLSKAELDQRCQPSGLYDSCAWEDKAIRKLVGDGRVAARCKGGEVRAGNAVQECPICFLYYSEINVTKCCSANLCTECYLQVRPQKEKLSSCPFCNHQKLSVSVAKKLSADQIQQRESDEQRVIEAQIRARDSKDEEDETGDEDPSESSRASRTDSFGSSLEQDSRVALMRARSESFASNEESNHQPDDSVIQALAMTPEERRRLEDEMRAQHSHPLNLQVEAEAQERRLLNDRAYHRSHSGTLRELRAQRAAEMFRSGSHRRPRGRGPGGRDWNQIVDAFERGGNGEVQSLDDIVVLEAAILLSMEEEGRQRDEDGFDAARHARDGFPLVRSFLSNRRDGNNNTATQEQVQSLARTLSSSRRRNQVLRATGASSAARNMPDTALDTAAMLMRGISEEEQMAMAIAASLQDHDNDASDEESATESSGAQEATTDVSRAVVGVIVEEEEEHEQTQESQADETPHEEVPSSGDVPVNEGVTIEADDSATTTADITGVLSGAEEATTNPDASPSEDTTGNSGPSTDETGGNGR